MITQRILEYIKQKQLFEPADRLLVALSGGADSVALLRLLHAMGYDCEAAHCNFHLRGEESDRDEAFVRQLCGELNIPLHVVHFNTKDEAQHRHLSIEMAARELRYTRFEETRRERGLDYIAVAHHRDDSAETFLLNLLRGTGINGLRGIRPKNGRIVRPLLCLDRKEILGYLDSLQQPYVTDSTNLQDEYMRNKIRLNLLPLMEEINPAARENLLRTARHLDEAAIVYDESVREAIGRITADVNPPAYNITALLREKAPATLLHELLHPLGFNTAQTDDIFRSLTKQAGKIFTSSTHRVVKDRDLLLVEPLDKKAERPVLQLKEAMVDDAFVIPRDKNTACLDADKLKEELTLRLVRTGDWFVPFGMTGRKRVSDYLTDRKFSRPQKERQWALCCGEDICWLVGERADNRFRIDAETKRALIVTIKPEGAK